MKLRPKLTLTYLVLALLTALLALLAFDAAQKLEHRFEVVVHQDFPLVEALEELQLAASRITDSAFEFGLLRSEQTQAGLAGADLVQNRDLSQLKDYHDKLELFQALAQKKAPRFEQFLLKLEEAGRATVAAAETLEELKRQRAQGQPMLAAIESLQKAQQAFEDHVAETLQAEDALLTRSQARLHLFALEMKESFLSLGLATVAAALGLGFWMAYKITRPVLELEEAAHDIARTKFDTRVPVRSQDEIGHLAQSFNQMAENLAETTVSRDYFASVVDAISSSLLVLDQEGRVTDSNHASGYLLGYTAKELKGKSWRDFLTPAPVNGGEGLDLAFLGCVDKLKVRYRNKEGKTLPMLLSSSSINGPDGQLVGYVLVAQQLITPS